jgi:hypothetical protein
MNQKRCVMYTTVQYSTKSAKAFISNCRNGEPWRMHSVENIEYSYMRQDHTEWNVSWYCMKESHEQFHAMVGDPYYSSLYSMKLFLPFEPVQEKPELHDRECVILCKWNVTYVFASWISSSKIENNFIVFQGTERITILCPYISYNNKNLCLNKIT